MIWRVSGLETSLGEVIELKRGFDLAKRDRIAGRVPLVSSSGVSDYHVEAKVKGPGVVTGRYGTLGQVFYVPDDFWPLNTTLYVRDFKGNDPRFISYFLKCLNFSAYSDKAAVPGLNRNHLHQEVVRIPAQVQEQRAIAHILGTLDDKIELNRAHERDAGGDGAGAVQVVVCGFRAGAGEDGGALAKGGSRCPVCRRSCTSCFPTGWSIRSWGRSRRGGG